MIVKVCSKSVLQSLILAIKDYQNTLPVVFLLSIPSEKEENFSAKVITYLKKRTFTIKVSGAFVIINNPEIDYLYQFV